MEPEQTQSVLLTVSETAELLRLGRDITFRLIHEGRIPALRIGKSKIRVPRAALMARIDEWVSEGVGFREPKTAGEIVSEVVQRTLPHARTKPVRDALTRPGRSVSPDELRRTCPHDGEVRVGSHDQMPFCAKCGADLDPALDVGVRKERR